MSKKRRKYCRDFKYETVRLAEESDESAAAAVARQLGIHTNLIYTWREQWLGCAVRC